MLESMHEKKSKDLMIKIKKLFPSSKCLFSEKQYHSALFVSVAASSRREIRKLNVFNHTATFIRLGTEGHLRCKRNAAIPRKLGCFALFVFLIFW